MRFRQFSSAMMKIVKQGVPALPLREYEYKPDVIVYPSRIAKKKSSIGTEKIWVRKRTLR